MKEGIVLFAHGSRDPQWAAPFKRIEQQLRQQRPDAEVRLAYLEIMQPSLDEALAELANEVDAIRIVPLFLGYGGHIKEDLPDLVAAANPRVKVTIDPPVGEQQSVIDAIAALVARG
ncbi:MAG: sirohydrochlorin chelatase [Betaproteobacteria bacterium]